MIDESRTLEIYGYTSDSLSHGSSKLVAAVCEECGKYREGRYKQYRELCKECAARKGHKHSEESKRKMCISSSGENNPNWKGDRIKKVCEQCGKVFEARHYAENSAHFCSNKCHGEYKSVHMTGKNNPFYGKKHTKETIEKMTGKNNQNWKGGIDFEPYCYKFNGRFKESVREKFNRVCFLCPTTEKKNGKKLSVHHVNYDKSCLCDDVVCEFVPLCASCHSKTNFNRDFWERLIIYALPYHEEERIIECIDILEMVTSNGKTCSWTALSCTIWKRAGLNQRSLTV